MKSLRYATKRRHFVMSRLKSASECIGNLKIGDEVTGLTCGQFSSIDILEHMLDELGGGDVMITTWTAGIYDIERAGQLSATGLIKSIRFLLDKTQFSRSPQYAGVMLDVFGINSFRDSNVHSKITIVNGRLGRGVMRASMNLNKNLKTEQFDISINDDVFKFYSDWFEKLWLEAGKKQSTEQVFQAVYDKYQQTRETVDIGGIKTMSEIAKNLRALT